MTSWLSSLDLRDVIIVLQDWGSFIGFRVVAENPDRFAKPSDNPAVAANRAAWRVEDAGPELARRLLEWEARLYAGMADRAPRNHREAE